MNGFFLTTSVSAVRLPNFKGPMTMVRRPAGRSSTVCCRLLERLEPAHSGLFYAFAVSLCHRRVELNDWNDLNGLNGLNGLNARSNHG